MVLATLKCCIVLLIFTSKVYMYVYLSWTYTTVYKYMSVFGRVFN